MRTEKLQRWHMEKLRDQGVVDAANILARGGYMEMLMEHIGWVGVVDDGVVCAVGMVRMEAGHLRCWAVTDPDLTSRNFLLVCKGIRRFLRTVHNEHIETVVEVGNIYGMRWVENVLGFHDPKPITTVRPDGSECAAMVYER